MLNKKHNETTFLLSISSISNHLKSQQMGESKIDVTATLRHAPSTRAEFLVSVSTTLIISLPPGPKFIKALPLEFYIACPLNF